MQYSKNAHIQKVNEIMRALSPAHQLKVRYYAETLQEIEQEQEAAKKGRGAGMTNESDTLIGYITRMLGTASLKELRIVYEFVLALTAPKGDEDE